MEPNAAPKHNDRPQLNPCEIVYSPELDLKFRINSTIGQGRCSVVYEVKSLNNKDVLALKVYAPGPNFESALWRELYILQLVGPKTDKIVKLVGYFRHKHYHCVVQELLSRSLQGVNYKMNQKGLSPWAIHKFLSGVLSALCVLHHDEFVHADLKPANVMWSADHGTFKVLDFGLSFHASEHDIYQVQSPGYQAPETRVWNAWKQKKRKESCETSTGEGRSITKEFTTEIMSGKRLTPENNGGSVFDEGKDIPRLTTAIDVWSVGCLTMEAATGHKLFQNPPGKENVQHLVTLKLDEFYRASNMDKDKRVFYIALMDFVLRCLVDDPAKRLTAEQALEHPVILDGLRFRPTFQDLQVFSSPVLRLLHLVNENILNTESEVQEMEGQLHKECLALGGPLISVRIVRQGSGAGHAYVCFQSSHDAKLAFKRLSGRLIRGRPVVVSYFPLELWRMGDLW